MIERITTLMTSQTMLGELNQQLNTLQNTQLELSSGKQINQPSDDPYGMSLALQLNSDLSAADAELEQRHRRHRLGASEHDRAVGYQQRRPASARAGCRGEPTARTTR